MGSGTSAWLWATWMVMECETVREALSAELDGEDPGIPGGPVAEHLAGCRACRSWYADVDRLARRTRVAPAPEPGPDVAGQVLAAVRLPRLQRGWWWRGLRAAVGLVALAQVGIGVVSLFEPLGLRLGMGAGAHMDHEEAAFNLAFAAALLLVAVRPSWARAQVPALASFVLVLAAASVFDLAAGAVGWARLATHAPIVLGLVLAAALHRMPQPHRGPAARVLSGRADALPVAEGWSGAGEHAPDQQHPPPAAQHEATAQRRSA